MGLGFIYISVVANAGISTGKPPACQTPRLTDSARSRRCRWQGLISLHVLTIAITGRPVKSSRRWPNCFRRERCPKPRSVSGPNHLKLRSSSGFRICKRFQHARNRLENVRRRTVPRDLEIPIAGVMRYHRTRDFSIRSKALANHVLAIVLACYERRAIIITTALHLRALRKNIEHPPALRALPAAHHSPHENLRGHVEMNDRRSRQASRSQQRIEIQRLLDGARIAVQHEAAPAVRLLNARTQGGVDQVVGNEATGRHDGLRVTPERCVGRDLGAQHIPGRYGGNRAPLPLLQPIDDEPALRPLAAARRPKEKNNQG